VTDPQTGWLTSVRRAGDTSRVEFLRPGQALGAVTLRVRTAGSPWREVRTSMNGVELTSRFRSDGDALLWEIGVMNTGNEALEVGDLALPLPMNTDYVWDHEETFVRRVFCHAFIAGHGSFLYWLPVRGSGSILVMQPHEGAALEYFTATDMDYAHGRERFTAFVYSKGAAEQEPRGTWRQSRTSRFLRPGEGFTIRFAFRWADSYEGVRELLRQDGGVDVQVAPGMVVPRDLTALLALRTTRKIESVVSEFPASTKVEYLGERGTHTHLYRVKFSRLGENLLTVRGAGGWTMPLEFFVTEPLETLIKKRAAFIVKNQQHRDPAKWYDGLYSLWDRRQPPGRNLLGPDNLGGQHPYAVSGSDDPSNSKCLLVAEKNAAFPDAGEIASLEYFIKHFVWGKHQRTAAEASYPYGIYGSDSWKQNRFADRDPLAEGVSRPGGPSACRMWRTFDYTTYFAFYFNMYRIAKQRPDLVKECSAAEYLERAYGTARAYFEVPANIHMEGGWSFTGWVYWQYTIGNFHEKYLLPLIAALETEGPQGKADFLRAEWEKKVKYFIYDHPWPFASEMPIDSTAYESTYAAGHYALERGLKADTNLWHDRNLKKWFSHPVIDPKLHEEFLRRQHLANLACRGVLEANYWSLGSDFRGCGGAGYTLSYMSQMGGWAVLDYALRHDPDPAANLRLGYASMLSSWALMNSGDAQSNFGFWTPGTLHDGAMSWGFQPRQVGTEWNPATRDLPRGAWPVCGEADHGLVAGIEAASTVLFDDPLFGMIAFGGEVAQTDGSIGVVPRDGVRQRFHAAIGARRLHLAMDRDGFAAEQPIRVSRTLDRVEFTIESRAPARHEATLAIEGPPPGQYAATVGAIIRPFRVNEKRTANFQIPVEPGQATAVRIEANASGALRGEARLRSDIQIRDPFILPIAESKTYYMYSAMSVRLSDGRTRQGVGVYTSKDLQWWDGPTPVFHFPDSFWADQSVWAPEVHRYQDKYYLFATFTSKDKLPTPNGRQQQVKRGTQILVSESPEGPFKLMGDKPHTPGDWMSLDGTFWVEDGVPYMLFCHEWVQVGDGTMELLRLNGDLSGPIGKPQTLFKASNAKWVRSIQATDAYVTDGPFLYRTNSGQLLMIWSSFDKDHKYAVGIACSTSGKVAGPWKQMDQPLLAIDGGHGMIFKTFDGRLVMPIHQPNQGKTRARLFELEDGGDTLRIRQELPLDNTK